jgi:acetylornithine deacetylase/succinyl-diaminopimelate desuccinylase-like protein
MKKIFLLLPIVIILYILFDFQGELVFEEKIKLSNLKWDKITTESTRHLSNYLKIKSIRGDEIKSVKFVKKILDLEGIKSTVIQNTKYPNRPILYAELAADASGDEGIILANHSDVVEADPTEWKPHGPFSGAIENGVIYGRGAVDMKGMAIMQLTAFIQLHRRKVKLKNPVMFVMLPDEETSGIGAKELIKYPALLSKYKYVLNEGGIGTSGIPASDIKIFNIQYAEKGMVWVDIKAKGLSGHGSSPTPTYASKKILNVLNEIINLEQAIQILPETEMFFSQMGSAIGGYKEFLLKRSSNPFITPLLASFIRSNKHINAITSNSRSLTDLRTPTTKGYNVISNKASARVDFRILPNTTTSEFIAELKKLEKKHNVEISVFNKLEPTKTNMNTKFFNTLATVAQANVKGSVVTPFMSPGLTDNNTLRSVGLQCYGLIPGLFTKDEISGMHGKNERITVQNLKLGSKIIYETLISLN